MEIDRSEEHIAANDKEVDLMPHIEQVEYERVAYIKGIEEYIQKLKEMPKNEAVKQSRMSLMSCNIIREDGEFTERYSYSRKHIIHKE